ncbi:CapA family protein [Paramicrobacterium fandaimingii]|uniref:CapA family protein n=1 Tax=Paramicrobacterium fandaimingii TaxID=2708079 RepID=UPI00142380E4|nr:CapA family protein [Microbacterium fandaimingii]
MIDSRTDAARLMFVGDLILGADDVRSHFGDTATVLRNADVAVGHVEWPHTRRGQVSSADLPAPAAPPGNLAAVRDAGFAVATLAGNHIFDQGQNGVEDTVDTLRAEGLATTGAGLSISTAREPAIVEHAGVRLGFLSYNAVGPRESWATTSKGGAAYVRIHAHYDIEMASPGSPPTEYTALDAETLSAMCTDIRELKERVDVVSVSLHKGLVFERARLAQYEQPLAYAAIDAGADVIIGHHAHILRGVETYKSRPIFHGVNHFVTAYPAAANPHSAASGARTRPTRSPILSLVTPDHEVENFPFSRDARQTMIAFIDADERGVLRAGFFPCWIDEHGHTTRAHGRRGEQIVQYVRDITAEAGLVADIQWDGMRAVFSTR